MKNKGITVVGGKSYVQAKIIMLPTEHNYFKIGDVIKHPEKNSIGIVKTENKIVHKNDLESGVKVHHICFVSDEEIKQGEWCYNFGLNRVEKAPYKINPQNEFTSEARFMRKIIATTDKSLNTHWNSQDHKYFPRPSNEFLQAYCKANGKIEEVLVEVGDVSGNPIPNYKLKVSPDNTITIKRVEERKITTDEMHLNMQYYMEYCQRNGYVSPMEWLENHKHF